MRAELEGFWTEELGCSDYREFGNGRDAMLMKMIFTVAIVCDLTPFYYGDRWCYHTFEDAKTALDAWDGEGEPAGWHRHPDSGRRRDGGNPAREYLQP